MPRGKLSDKICRTAPAPARGDRLVRCGEVVGLALRATTNGARAFVFSYRTANGRERRLTIGSYPDWSLVAAKRRVAELRRRVDVGEDPLEERRRLKAAKTLGDLWRWYEDGPLLKLALRTQGDVRSTFNRIVIPGLGAKTSLADIQRRDVQQLVDRVTSGLGPYAANRAHSYLRRVLNLAVAEGWLERNVATMAITRNLEPSQHRAPVPPESR